MIPTIELVIAIKYFYAPAVKDLKVNGFNTFSINLEYIVIAIAIWRKGVGYKYRKAVFNQHIYGGCGYTVFVIGDG